MEIRNFWGGSSAIKLHQKKNLNGSLKHQLFLFCPLKFVLKRYPFLGNKFTKAHSVLVRNNSFYACGAILFELKNKINTAVMLFVYNKVNIMQNASAIENRRTSNCKIFTNKIIGIRPTSVRNKYFYFA